MKTYKIVAKEPVSRNNCEGCIFSYYVDWQDDLSGCAEPSELSCESTKIWVLEEILNEDNGVR